MKRTLITAAEGEISVVIGSVVQIELKAKPVGDFLCAPLKPDQVSRCISHVGLPTVGVVFANNDFQPGDTNFCFDHVSEAFCSDAFLDHNEVPQDGNVRVIRARKSKRSVKKYG